VNAAFPPPEEWTTWDFFTLCCSEEQFLGAVNRIHHIQDNDRFRPYPESKGFLGRLKEEGCRVIIASHRREDMRVPTERWLRKRELVYDELPLSFDKTVLFGSAAVVVDDAPQTLEEAVASKAVGEELLFPWNSLRGKRVRVVPGPERGAGIHRRATQRNGGRSSSRHALRFMTRALRIEYIDAVYHITSRSPEKKAVFKSD
jgi:hypothetical protein